LVKNLEIDGFRKGHVPEAMVVKHVGEMAILTEMAERAISHFYHHILEAHEIDAIGHPKIEITKIAPNNPLGFTATVAVLPEITLPDYKKIADTHNKEKASDKVSDEELETKIKDILRQKVAYERLQNKASNQTTEGENLPNPETIEKEEDIVIPELTDEVAKITWSSWSIFWSRRF
jgi:trigger factor